MATSTTYFSYGAPTALTCTLANLATGAARTSDAQDMTASVGIGRPIDVLFSLKLTLTTGAATGNDNAVYIYPYATVDEVNYTMNATGVDAAYTIVTDIAYLGPFVISFPTATGAPSWVGGPWSLATVFGGTMPKRWGIIVYNRTNSILNTATTMTATYMKVWNVTE